MKPKISERRTIYLVGGALIILLGYSFAVKPFLESGSPVDQSTRIEEARNTLAKAANIRERHDKYALALQLIEGHYLSEAAIDEGGIALLALVEQIADQTGVTLTSKGIAPAKDKAVPPKVAVEVNGRGDPGAMAKFLYGLRSSNIRLDVERLDFVIMDGRMLQIRTIVATLLPRAKGGADNE